MRVIYKVKLTGADQEFSAPVGARPLRAQVQRMSNGLQPILYLICDRQALPAKYQVKLIPTGLSFGEDDGEYVDTITLMTETGPLNLHLFYKQLGIIQADKVTFQS